jgi:mRNA-degrading endonuclease RelE of RelBE toxin-antitoxin system
MLRPSARVAGPYRVTFSPEAWRKIGLIPSSTFEALQVAVDRLASNLGSRSLPGEDAHTKQRLRAAGLHIVYQRDDETRTLTVVEFLPDRSAS